MELTKYERYTLEKIEKWEKEKHKGLHKKILDLTSRPVDYVMEKIGTEKFKKFENAIGAAVNKLLYASTYTVDPEKLIKRAHDHGMMIKDIAELKTCNLWLLDKCNRKQINFHEWAATIQGAVAGIGPDILVDVHSFHSHKHTGTYSVSLCHKDITAFPYRAFSGLYAGFYGLNRLFCAG